MSLAKLPILNLHNRPHFYRAEPPEIARAKWRRKKRPAARASATDTVTIEIMEAIGADPWTGGGVTAKAVMRALAEAGGKPVTVLVNSPGGDMFEGAAIYNALLAHPAAVTVKVMGVAASAASLIAMAGDRIIMGRGATMMIHNAWGMVVGNRHDFDAARDAFAVFDRSMASIYAARSGMNTSAIAELMDGEKKGADGTYMTAAEAVERGFADDMVEEEEDPDAEDDLEEEEDPDAEDDLEEEKDPDAEDDLEEEEEDPDAEDDLEEEKDPDAEDDLEEEEEDPDAEDETEEDEEEPVVKRKRAAAPLDVKAKRRVEKILAAAKVPRSKRRQIITEIAAARDAGRKQGVRDAAKRKAARDAGSVKALRGLLKAIRS